MRLDEFKVGKEFWIGDRQYRCTDIGSRVVVAIRVDQVEVGGTDPRMLDKVEAQAEGWFNGPPYAVAEHVFDEDDLEACTITKEDD